MRVVGHRGWPAKYPENSLPGFAAAVALGVDAIELDVHLTRDDHVVVFHDEDTKRVADRDVSVRQSTLAELKTLDVGAKYSPRFAGTRIPTLGEVIEVLGARTSFFVEVKDPRETAARLNARLVPMIDALAGRVVVQSFSADYLRTFRVLRPDVPTGFLCAASGETIARTLELGCAAIHPSWDSLTPALNRASRDAGLGIYIWNLRRAEDCARVLDLDVDAVGVDHPDVMLELLGRGPR